MTELELNKEYTTPLGNKIIIVEKTSNDFGNFDYKYVYVNDDPNNWCTVENCSSDRRFLLTAETWRQSEWRLKYERYIKENYIFDYLNFWEENILDIWDDGMYAYIVIYNSTDNEFGKDDFYIEKHIVNMTNSNDFLQSPKDEDQVMAWKAFNLVWRPWKGKLNE